MRLLPLRLLCLAVISVILCLGLWPFHAPKNDVRWLSGSGGLQFGDYGTVISSGAFQSEDTSAKSSCSIEIWLQPAHIGDSGTILAFYHGQKHIGLSLHQSGSNLSVVEGKADEPYPASALRIYVDKIFLQRRPVLLTLTTGAQGTLIYVDGTLVRMTRNPLSATACTGRFVLGDSALQQDTWSGQVKGLAIYYSKLPATAVLAHYQAWSEHEQPDVAPIERCVGLYCFRELSGSIAHNRAGNGIDLKIPSVYTVQDQIILEPFWEEFNMSWGYWNNVLKNIVGFVPLGFCFCAYFSQIRLAERPTMITVVSGATVSLTIEVIQGYLPTRQSGTTDIITNTLGTYIGVLSYQIIRPILAKI